MSEVLEVKGLSKSFGGVQAIRDLSFTVGHGEVVGLIGPNGSGKSTTVNTLAGTLRVTSGEILLAGGHIQNVPEYERVELGLTRTFQTASLFPDFTVREQVTLGAESTRRSAPVASIFGLGTHAGEEEAVQSQVEDALELTGLLPIAEKQVGTISSAEQRFLMIATALASNPKIILLDEPAAGMISHERKTLTDMIKRVRERGISVLVIEHHMALIMEVSDRIVVLNFGQKIAEGTPLEIRENKAVIDAYLGEVA